MIQERLHHTSTVSCSREATNHSNILCSSPCVRMTKGDIISVTFEIYYTLLISLNSLCRSTRKKFILGFKSLTLKSLLQYHRKIRIITENRRHWHVLISRHCAFFDFSRKKQSVSSLPRTTKRNSYINWFFFQRLILMFQL